MNPKSEKLLVVCRTSQELDMVLSRLPSGNAQAILSRRNSLLPGRPEYKVLAFRFIRGTLVGWCPYNTYSVGIRNGVFTGYNGDAYKVISGVKFLYPSSEDVKKALDQIIKGKLKYKPGI